MRTGIVAARDESGLGLLDQLKACERRSSEFDFRRILFWADDNEVVVHD
jgi:hypothetical protein